MTRRRIKNILLKEWRLLFTDVNSTMIVTVLPFLIVGQAMLYIWLAVTFATNTILGDSLFRSALAKLAQAIPMVASLAPREQVQVLLLNQFNLFLLLIPTMISVSIATFSIVDEKLSGSLEALLATPVRTWELLFGKAISGAVPAMVMTWISAGVFLLVVAGLGWGGLIGFVVTPAWFLSLFLLSPAVALLSFMLGVIGSSRAKDAKGAQTISLVIIFPVFALIAVQVIGILWFTPLLTLALALVVGAIDYIVLRMAVRLFQRESILVRWK
jgi:ABC-2 type transport system permease protein